MKTLYFDCFSGVSGDMLVGALVDLGVEWAIIEAAIDSLGLPAVELSHTKVIRASLAACKFTVKVSNEDEDRGHLALTKDAKIFSGGEASLIADSAEFQQQREISYPKSHFHNDVRLDQQEHHSYDAHSQDHHHPHEEHHHEEHHVPDHHQGHHSHHHEHRHYQEVAAIIDRGALSSWVKKTAKQIFWRLTEAEAAVHGVDPHKVALHEVGAADAIVDVVAACVGLEYLGVNRFMASPLHVGQGFVNCAHGHYPIPVPGALRLLKGIPTYTTAIRGELVTPTGAAIVTTLCQEFGPLPLMTIEQVGYGAGSRDIPNFPNVLRIMLGQCNGSSANTTTPTRAHRDFANNEVVTISEEMVVVEANIDDLNPQIYGYLLEELLKLGAADVYYTPVYMKKNRPATLLTVVASPRIIPTLISKILRETTTLGVRQYPVNRQILARQIVPVETPWGTVKVKLAFSGEELINSMPEYEDCLNLAREQQIPLAFVQATAQNMAWATYGIVVRKGQNEQ